MARHPRRPANSHFGGAQSCLTLALSDTLTLAPALAPALALILALILALTLVLFLLLSLPLSLSGILWYRNMNLIAFGQ